MKKLRVFSILLSAIIFYISPVYGQGFVKSLDSDGIATLYGSECVATLQSGEEIHGKFRGGTVVNAALTKIVIKYENGEKARFKPEDLVSLKIKTTKLAKLDMMAESATSIKEFVNADFDEIVNREYIIFETALAAKKKDTYRLLQLLNPGFDNKIKVFATDAKTGGFAVNGIAITGGADRTYLFVKGGDKAVLVKKSTYRKDFSELFGDCSNLLKAFGNEKIKWNDVAGHVFAYEKACE